MVIAYTGTKGEPVAIPSGAAPTFAADLTEIMDWVQTGRSFRKAATQAALNSATGMDDNDLAQVDNIDGAWFRYDGTAAVWRMYGIPVFDTASARTTAITAPVDNMLSIRRDADVLEQYLSGSWGSAVPNPGSLVITPTGQTVTGGTGAINADGSVTVTGAATVVRVNGVFLAAYRQVDCYVDVDGNNANVVVTYQFCAGATIETATQYNFSGSISATGTVTGYSPGAQASMHQGGNFARQFTRAKLEVERANLAEITSVRLKSAVYAASAATPGDVSAGGALNTTTPYDGLVINITGASSTATMKLRFVGIV